MYGFLMSLTVNQAYANIMFPRRGLLVLDYAILTVKKNIDREKCKC